MGRAPRGRDGGPRPASSPRGDSEEPTDAVPGVVHARPTEPWVPSRLVVHPVGKAKTTRRRGRDVRCWDVRGAVDGWPYFRRFTQPDGSAERARAWAARLVEDFEKGWAYDPGARQFLEPAPAAADVAARPTVLDCALDFLDRKWDVAWEPKSRQAAVRALTRACTHLVDEDAPDPPSGDVAAYLAAVLCPAGRRPEVLDAGAARGGTWLAAHSLPMDRVHPQQLEVLVARYRTNQRNPAKQVSQATEHRFVADLRQFWADAAGRHHFTDPWPAVQATDRAAARRNGRATPSVDEDLVLSPVQVVLLAVACGAYGSWGPEVVAFVLVMGICGLRPNEAVGLRIGDLDLPPEGPGWIRTARSRRPVTERWLAPDEDAEWGPLRDRAVTESRRAPVPTWLAPVLRTHLDLFRHGASARDLVFAHGGRPYDLSVFDRDVWGPARANVFPKVPGLRDDDPHQPKHSRLRRHDLRHAACALWLQAGVDVKVCQAWSGHRRLGDFLDVYEGIMPAREEEGLRALDAALGDRGLAGTGRR